MLLVKVPRVIRVRRSRATRDRLGDPFGASHKRTLDANH
jgi:hypothetical protein